MRSRLNHWMWSEALSVLDRAERLHRQFFTQSADAWEPPVDIVEVGEELRIHVALPGVTPDAVTVGLEPGGVTISALRAFPGRHNASHIHRLEIPYGRFERRIGISLDEKTIVEKTLGDGVLTLRFRKKESQ